MTKTEIQAHRAAWVAALRSGKYQQTTGRLRRTVVGPDNTPACAYCCLGVGADIIGCQWDQDEVAVSSNTSLVNMLNGDYRHRLGIGYHDQYELIRLNDDLRQDFNKIADYIENLPVVGGENEKA